MICLALILFVQAKNVYPQLLLGRLFFSIGAAAASTMVTAVLPTMSYADGTDNVSGQRAFGGNRHAQAPSIASELTITPDRFRSASGQPNSAPSSGLRIAEQMASTSKVAGFVGMFTGLGALLALLVFLPLPANFQRKGVSPGLALQYSYYIVAAIALVLSFVCLLGLSKLKSESKKGWRYLTRGLNGSDDKPNIQKAASETSQSLYRALVCGFQRSDIGIGYLGGFVARASSVGISLFIPLLVNALFLSSGLCDPHAVENNPAGLPDIKRKCPRAYIVAAELTGVAEVVALVAAPLFGYWSAKTSMKSLPLAAASLAGIVGYPLFAARFNPDDENKADRAMAFVAVCLIGFSQIGAIVCSLASLSKGVLSDAQDARYIAQSSEIPHTHTSAGPDQDMSESQPLLPAERHAQTLSELKGSLAGIYSFYGGAAILLLTKAGGALFDTVSEGAPFYIMAMFNGLLLLACIAVGLRQYRDEGRS